MNNFLAQTTQLTHEQIAVGGGSAAVFLYLIKVAADLTKETIMSRTVVGKKIKNGSGCKVTPEVIDVIMEKDGEGRRLIHNKHASGERRHKEIVDAQIKHALILEKIATILEGMERRQ